MALKDLLEKLSPVGDLPEILEGTADAFKDLDKTSEQAMREDLVRAFTSPCKSILIETTRFKK
jgi:hypothetical protein